ncbi:MAG: DUF6049 family protein [Actinomycetota bacterium]|nr:DUF6049 family protein [Actinomycetota bacterium]
MRRLAASLAATLVLAALAPEVAAQTITGEVSLVLVRQSPWNTLEQPLLRLGVRATNHGTAPLTNLSLGITVWSPVRSRTAYKLSLTGNPADSVFLFGETLGLKGTLEPGETRTFLLQPIDLSVFPHDLASSGQSAIYPLVLDLRSDDASLATIRSPIIFLVFPQGQHRALTPLRLSCTFVLDKPILYGPDGVFDADAVRVLLAPGGRIRQEVNGLGGLVTEPHPPAIDLVLSPMLLDQLDRLQHGFTERAGSTEQHVAAGQGASGEAASLLQQIKKIAASPTVELSALPFADPSVPALVAAGLGGDLSTQLERGRQEVEAVTGVTPDRDVVRPPHSKLDQASLFALWQQGFHVFLVDPELVRNRPAQEKDFAQPATTALQVSPTETVTAIIPDADTQGLLTSDTLAQDPRLAAQSVLGELAQIWLERPGVERSLAISFPETLPLPGDLFAPLLPQIGAAPWLTLQKATTIARNFPPPSEPASLDPNTGATFPDWYVGTLRSVRTDIQTYRSILVRPNPLPDRLETTVLLAESDSFTDQHLAGRRFLDSVRDRLATEFDKVRPNISDPARTLASRNGIIPVGITNGTGYPVRVSVRLVSNRLSFLPADTQAIRLSGDSATLLFHVQARTTGRFPVQVQILTPTGVELTHDELVVRSTAYNLVALIITIGAALFLLAWWGRRFLPRFRARTRE